MKFILTVPKEIHLGFIKETFGRGAVLDLDEDRGIIIVDGRKFDDTRDLELLQRQALKNPERPWIMPWSQDLYDAIKGNVAAVPAPVKKPRPGADMPIVQDDSDDHPVIDIRHTQVSKRHQEEKEASRTAARNREVGGKMEVIQGDESAEERLARLKGKGDMQSMSERVALKRKRADMPIVHDDSLGMGVGRNEIPMNAGQHLPSRAEAEAKTDEKVAEAELRKQHAKMARKRAGIAEPDGTVDQDIPPELAEAVDVVGGTNAEEIVKATESAVSGVTVSDEDAAALEADFEQEAAKQSEEGTEESGTEAELRVENAKLRHENVELKTVQGTILERLVALEKGAKAPAKKAVRKRTARKGTKVTRTPVSKE